MRRGDVGRCFRIGAVLAIGFVLMGVNGGCSSHESAVGDVAQQGFTALNDHRVADALALFQQAADRGSIDPDVWRALTGLHMQARAFADAARTGQRLTELAPNAPDGWKLLGTACFRQGSYYRAFDAFARAAGLTPGDLDVQQGLGQSGIQIGRLDEAKQAFEKVLQARPEYPLALAGHALVTLRMEPSPEGLALAEREVTHALTLKETGNAHLVRAQVYLAQRRYQEAITECKTLTTRYPHLNLAYSYLAKAYASSGQPDLARQAGARYEALRNGSSTSVQPDEGGAQP